MSLQLISLSPDLRRLRDEGYEVTVISGHLVVSHVPYINAANEIALGSLVSTLTLSGDETTTPDSHVIYFIGSTPCDAMGTPMHSLIHSEQLQQLATDLTTNFIFSHKPVPSGQYPDYYAKMTTYTAILLQEATAIDPGATAKTFAPVVDEEDSVFNYIDTAASRAGISAISAKLAIDRVALIGLGGTGGYILDLLAKTPIRELHLFDGDTFLQHNAFRAPGAPTIDELRSIPYKVDYLASRYSAMRKGIFAHPVHVTNSNLHELDEMQFVFLAVDDGLAKEAIITHLEKTGVNFIDVGMGLYESGGALGGLVRTTASLDNAESRAAARGRISFGDNSDNDYVQNIQIADLNAINAALAVIKFKKLLGFFLDLDIADTSTYTIDSNLIVNDDPR